MSHPSTAGPQQTFPFSSPLTLPKPIFEKIPLISRSSSQLRYPMEHEQDDQPLVCRLVKPLTPGGPPAFLSIPRCTLAYSRSRFHTLPRAVWFLGVPTPLKDPAYSPSISLSFFFLSTGTTVTAWWMLGCQGAVNMITCPLELSIPGPSGGCPAFFQVMRIQPFIYHVCFHILPQFSYRLDLGPRESREEGSLALSCGDRH